MTDAFAARAQTWDENPVRAASAKAFFEAAQLVAGVAATGEVLDFGCGTGLIGLNFAPEARRVVLVDDSPAMLAVLKAKIAALSLTNTVVHQSGLGELPAASAGLIVSLMALHHVPDTAALLTAFRRLIAPGGKIIVGDLVSEDGGFHAPEVVAHNGFDPEALGALFAASGFRVLETRRHHTIRKAVADGSQRDFPLFLIHAEAAGGKP